MVCCRRYDRRLAGLYARIAHIRHDATHQATTKLAKTFWRIGIEALNVRGMPQNRHLAGSIMDGTFSNSGGNSTIRRDARALWSSLPIDGFLQARPALAAASSKTRRM